MRVTVALAAYDGSVGQGPTGPTVGVAVGAGTCVSICVRGLTVPQLVTANRLTHSLAE